MKYLLLLLLSLTTVVGYSSEVIKVVDAEDSSALPGATVFSKSGIILGLTDKNGEITITDTSFYPLYISYMGYEPENRVEKGTSLLKMRHAIYDLNEVVVKAGDRPVERVVCYMREYLSAVTDKESMLFYNEHMVDFFLVTGKVKGFKNHNTPRILKSNLYTRITQASRDSIFRPTSRDATLSWENLASLPQYTIDTANLLEEGSMVSKNGKFGVKEQLRLTPTTLVHQSDAMAEYKDHVYSPSFLKLLGLTLDFTELLDTWVYRRNENGFYDITDIVSGKVSVKNLGRGKILKKIFNSEDPVEMYAAYEIYPISFEYLSVEEAKEMYKNMPDVDMTVSPNALPLPDEISKMIEQASTR